MTVRYGGMLAGRSGRAKEQISLPASVTLADLMALIWTRYPALKAIALPEGGGLTSMIRWLVNSRTAAEETPLSAGDEISLLPGAGGG